MITELVYVLLSVYNICVLLILLTLKRFDDLPRHIIPKTDLMV